MTDEAGYTTSRRSMERMMEKLARRFEVGERIELHGVNVRVVAIEGLRLVLEAGVSRGRIGSVSNPAQPPGQDEGVDGK